MQDFSQQQYQSIQLYFVYIIMARGGYDYLVYLFFCCNQNRVFKSSGRAFCAIACVGNTWALRRYTYSYSYTPSPERAAETLATLWSRQGHFWAKYGKVLKGQDVTLTDMKSSWTLAVSLLSPNLQGTESW